MCVKIVNKMEQKSSLLLDVPMYPFGSSKHTERKGLANVGPLQLLPVSKAGLWGDPCPGNEDFVIPSSVPGTASAVRAAVHRGIALLCSPSLYKSCNYRAQGFRGLPQPLIILRNSWLYKARSGQKPSLLTFKTMTMNSASSVHQGTGGKIQL